MTIDAPLLVAWTASVLWRPALRIDDCPLDGRSCGSGVNALGARASHNGGRLLVRLPRAMPGLRMVQRRHAGSVAGEA